MYKVIYGELPQSIVINNDDEGITIVRDLKQAIIEIIKVKRLGDC